MKGTILALTLFLVVVCAQPFPGWKLTVEQDFVNKATQTITPLLEDLILTLNFPNQSGTEHITLVGDIDWTVTNIDMKSVDFSQDQLTILPGYGLQLQVTDGSGEFTCDWSWKRESGIIHYGDSGSATVNYSKLTMTLQLQITDVNFRPQLQVLKFDYDLGKLDISVSSPWTGWIYNFFIWLFNGVIKSAVESVIVNGVTAFIDQNIDAALLKMPIDIPLFTWSSPPQTLDFDIALTQNPEFTSTYATVAYVGSINLNNQAPPFSPTRMLPDYCSTEDVNILINSFVFESGSLALFDSGLLNLTLTPQNVPNSVIGILNTTYWQAIIPKLYTYYPNALMHIGFNATAPPSVNISSAGFYGNATYNVNFFVQNITTGNWDLVLILSAWSDIQFSLYLTDAPNTLHVNLTILDLNLKVVNSKVGKVNLLLTNTAIGVLLHEVVEPLFNAAFNDHGIPLPTIPVVQLVDPNFEFYTNYICIESSVNFNTSQVLTRSALPAPDRKVGIQIQ